MQLRKAERRKAKLRVGVTGPSGSGKTYTGLLISKGLVDSWEKICLIDSENGSGELYSHLGDYNVITLQAPFSPERYIEAINEAVKAGMEVIFIDSVSHEWDGKGGCLEINELLAKTKFRGNTWGAWSETTPRHQKFIESITQAPVHVITSARSKTDTIQTEDKKIKKVGLKDIQREGFEYELTLSFNIDRDKHYATASKDRTGMFIDLDPFVITEETGKQLREWAEKGTEPLPVQQANYSAPIEEEDPNIIKSKIIYNLRRLKIYDLPKEFTNEQIGKYVADTVKLITNIELIPENYKAILSALEKMKLDNEDDQFILSSVKKPTPTPGPTTGEQSPKPETPPGDPGVKPEAPANAPAPEQGGSGIFTGQAWELATDEDIKFLWDLATDVDFVAQGLETEFLNYLRGEMYPDLSAINKLSKLQVRNLVKKLQEKKEALKNQGPK